MPHIDQLFQPNTEDQRAVVAPLDEFTRSQGFVWHQDLITIALRDDGDRIIGGVLGEAHWGWLRVKILAVPSELRGQGWGTQLMRGIERIAVERGCRNAWVDTFSFQARPFYERLGYKVFGTLPDYPAGHERYFLTRSIG